VSKNLDDDLENGLDPDVAATLNEWAEIHDRYFRLEHWLVNGRSRAPVAVVVETDEVTEVTRMLVLKVLQAEDGRLHELEYKRHREAVREAPEFAKLHLTRFVYDAVPAGTGRWITFQSVAGNELPRTEVLTVLLRRMVGIKIDVEPAGTAGVPCSPEQFAGACRDIVHGVLHSWAGPPYIPGSVDQVWTVHRFLRAHIGDQMDPGGRLHEFTHRYQGEVVQIPGETQPLPSPFALAKGTYFSDSVTVDSIVGRTHGDLHSDNALVQIRPFETKKFFLIDTALYEKHGPVTRDPMHFVLYIIARAFEALSPLQCDALIDLLLDPDDGPHDLVPGWLDLVVRAVHEEAVAWVHPNGLESRWRQQTLLSIVGCAMLFLGRTSTPADAKPWFLRLAARAAAAFEQGHPNAARCSASVAAADDRTGPDTAGWLCRHYLDLEKAAKGAGRLDAVERFRTDALGGVDCTEELRELVRQLGGPQFDPRFGTPGTEGEFQNDVYRCPLHLCRRLDRREPGKAGPQCHLSRVEPRGLIPGAR
jgi:hypothetical protein